MPLVREGAFEVLFRDNRFNYNDQTNNVCWNAFDKFRNNQQKLPSFTDLIQLQTMFTTTKRYIDAMQIFFEFYWKCDIEQVNVEMGKRLTSLTGFVDLVIGGVFQYVNKIKDPAWINNVVYLVDQANLSGSEASWKRVGEPVGILLADFFHYEIPNYDYYYGDFMRNKQ